MLDARAAWPVLVMLLHMRIYTMIFAVFVMVVFYFLEQRGLSFFAALRAFRVWIVTKKRPNYRPSDLTRMVDFAFEALPERFVNEKPIPKNGVAPGRKNNPAESVSRAQNKATVPPAKNSQ